MGEAESQPSRWITASSEAMRAMSRCIEIPLLVLYDHETEAIFAVAVASKATKPLIVEFVKNILYELGYGQLKISIKRDGASGLQELRRAISNSHEASR